MDYQWDFGAVWAYRGLLLSGVWMTLWYTVSSVVVGLLLGLLLGSCRTFCGPVVGAPVRAVIEVFRCTPLLVQLIWMYYSLPVLVGIALSPAMAAFLTLSLYTAAFYAEIFRGGIGAIDKGQWEGGKAIGMHPFTIFRRIILPQAIRIMVPSFINTTIMQVKNTSLISTIALADLVYQGTQITSQTYRPLETYSVVAAIYFVILFPLTLIAEKLEHKMGAHK